ncbi:hypothetical protein [Paenarthrobacter sp. JL.01a]|uniref:hypothetical protein n=1 Tax=Paenarthrobacter sp. JL.01a TaxID=2979324 RepID=UPI0021C6A719|nr:hypothetical protein [Paenarthrobacter sp. JL.01a]UXM90795.1 hypothetical protein N5P29_16070 [Paenarthrobacter sp. JL.01a]
MKRGWKIGCAGAVLLALSSCAGPGIEELGRSAIRDRAADGMDWFTGFTSAADTSDRNAVRSRLQGTNIAYMYGWDPDGNFYADRYYREHLTTSGGCGLSSELSAPVCDTRKNPEGRSWNR